MKAVCPRCEIRPKHFGPSGARWPYCMECTRAYENARPKAPKREASKRRHRADPRKRMVLQARRRAKKRGIPCTLTDNDVVIPEFCPVFGTRLQVGTRQSKRNAPSIDLIKYETGYVPGNIRVISHRANTLRSNATVEELEKVLAYSRGL